MPTLRLLARPVAVLASGVLVATTLTTPAYAAAEDRSARWLERQLTDGLVHDDQYDFDDYGLTADVGIALDYIGGRRDTVRQIARALAPNVDSWTTGVDWGQPGDVYAGSVAKAIVMAQSAGRDPRSFGGVDLVKRLNRRVSSTEPYVGRIEDKGETDYANTIGQVFATVGLADAGSKRAGDVRRFLLEQQCSKGYFRLYFAPKDSPQQGCDAGTPDQSAPDTDATALAVIGLHALPKRGPKVRKAVADAVGWLKRTQRRDGSFGGGTGTKGSNSNSTGLAAWALGDHGACRPAVRAAQWVRKLQVRGDVAGTPLAGEKGAIAYNRAALRTAENEGITTEARDQWRRATAQAGPGLEFLTLARCRDR